MTYAITSQCISCQRCQTTCPTDAIRTDGTAFWIDVNRCNQCRGTHGVPQCWAVCPTNEGCVPLASGTLSTSAAADYWDAWFATYSRLVDRLQASPQSRYWRQWFDAYSGRLEQMLHHNAISPS